MQQERVEMYVKELNESEEMKKIMKYKREWERDMKAEESDSSYYEEEDSDIQKEIFDEHKN